MPICMNVVNIEFQNTSMYSDRNRMEESIQKISKSKRSTLQIHFTVNRSKTITSLKITDLNKQDALILHKDLQWMINLVIPYPKSCGYEIVMKLDFSDLS